MRSQKQIINEIELLLAELKRTSGVGSKKQTTGGGATTLFQKSTVSFSGLAGEIHALVREGFFKEPKDISEIQQKLKDEGVLKPTTSLMPSLMRLVRKKVLGRNKPPKGKYKYFQR